jgi:hypothetical protein
MLITSLDQMEKIVSSNKSLKWDGWTVINYTYTPTAWTKTNGAFLDGKWYTANRYEPTESGWDIPAKFVGKDAQK